MADNKLGKAARAGDRRRNFSKGAKAPTEYAKGGPGFSQPKRAGEREIKPPAMTKSALGTGRNEFSKGASNGGK